MKIVQCYGELWISGDPPLSGWWLCPGNWWRYWDGDLWSYGARPGYQMKSVARAARMKCERPISENMVFCLDYPKNARVPRIDPRKQPKVKK